jgi:hypothetical protein
MTSLASAIPTTFGTLGVLSRQTRELLNEWVIPQDANSRPVAICLADRNIDVLPEELNCVSWMYLEEDSEEDPVLVLPAMAGNRTTYIVASLTERATLVPLEAALHHRRIELVIASPGGLTTHCLNFSSEEARHLQYLLDEYLDFCPAHDPDWLEAFTPIAPRLPELCTHLSPAIAQSERNTLLVLQGSYGNHLTLVRKALRQTVM